MKRKKRLYFIVLFLIINAGCVSESEKEGIKQLSELSDTPNISVMYGNKTVDGSFKKVIFLILKDSPMAEGEVGDEESLRRISGTVAVNYLPYVPEERVAEYWGIEIRFINNNTKHTFLYSISQLQKVLVAQAVCAGYLDSLISKELIYEELANLGELTEYLYSGFVIRDDQRYVSCYFYPKFRDERKAVLICMNIDFSTEAIINKEILNLTQDINLPHSG